MPRRIKAESRSVAYSLTALVGAAPGWPPSLSCPPQASVQFREYLYGGWQKKYGTAKELLFLITQCATDRPG